MKEHDLNLSNLLTKLDVDVYRKRVMLPSAGMRRILLGSIGMFPCTLAGVAARSLAERELTNYRGARSAEHEDKNGSGFASRDVHHRSLALGDLAGALGARAKSG
jgi:hypothetical protein